MKSKVPGVSDADYTKMHNAGLSDALIASIISASAKAGTSAAGTVDVSGIKKVGETEGATAAAQAILANPTGQTGIVNPDTSLLGNLQSLLSLITNGNVLRITLARSLLIAGGTVGLILGFVLIASGSETVRSVAKDGAKAAATAAIL